MPPSEPRVRWPLTAAITVAAIAAVKLILHLYAGRYYGYFVDELYNLALARHLAWGYMDVAPMIALIGRIELTLFGSSLSAIRLAPALAGAGLVLLTGAIARELGGRRFAQGLAALCVLLAPGILALDHFLNVNAFEPLCWMGCALLLIRIINTGNQKLWLWFGLVAGVGLETKHSMLIFGFALIAGLVLTPQRKHLVQPLAAARRSAGVPAVSAQPAVEHSPAFPLSGTPGEHPPRRPQRQPVLRFLLWPGSTRHAAAERSHLDRRPLVAGARALPRARIRLAHHRRAHFHDEPAHLLPVPRVPHALCGGRRAIRGVAVRARGSPGSSPRTARSWCCWAPCSLPPCCRCCRPKPTLRYARATHLEQPRIENHKLGPLPQLFADQFGWEDMAATVAGVYNGLPADIRARTAIFGQNYGQAGAIDLFGPHYGLPPAISGHQNYFLWGPRGATGESMIVMEGRQADLETKFASVQKVAHVGHPYAMPYEHFDIFYCQGLKMPLAELWPTVKNWH